MSQNSKQTGIVSQTISNMEFSSDSEESSPEIPIPVVQPKATGSKTAPKGKAGKGRKKKASTGESSVNNGDYDMVFDDLPSTRPKEIITNKCKIGL